MRNILLTICYRGSAYHGFQVQKNALTVCEVLQDAMQRVLGSRDDVKGCSRTDAGVHASRYCVSFHTQSAMPVERMAYALNCVLPPDVAVLSAREVADDFHARYSCRGKRYVYRIYNAPVRSPFWEGLALYYPRPLDLGLCNAVCAQFVGTHDFAAMCGSKNEQTDTTRTLTACQMRREGDLVLFSVEGDGFLYNMVRILVGTVLAVQEGRLRVDDIPDILTQRRRRIEARTAPAHGRYLDEVFY